MKSLKKFSNHFRVKPEDTIDLSAVSPRVTFGITGKGQAKRALLTNLRRLESLQYLLYAQRERALLIILQGMDTAGKDGTIRHVMRGFNPLGCSVVAFKAPSEEECNHHFLWRIDKVVPGRGEVAIFNRSQYEDILVPRVHELVPRAVWSARFEQINAFEAMLHANDVLVLKFFLHISKDEQRQRLAKRLTDERRRWKFSLQDLAERKLWDSYMKAYEDILVRCSTEHAPWYVIPADRKWFRNLAVSQVIIESLEALHMQFPKPSVDLSNIQLD